MRRGGGIGEGVIGVGAIDVENASARLWLAWSGEGLTSAIWADASASAREALGAIDVAPGAVPEPYRGVLERYFAGEAVEPATLPVHLQGTAFQLKVWNALRRIPRGDVRSYASIARDVGSPRGMRAVGGANGRNPIAVIVPCHRVVEADMTLGGYSGGLQYKRYLLALEGSKLTGTRVQPGQLDLLGAIG
jgi:O-6-methylguanine DNA methyltransferase